MRPKNWLNNPKFVIENALFIASFKEAISFFECNQKVIHIQDNNKKITMNQLEIDIRIRLASNKNQ